MRDFNALRYIKDKLQREKEVERDKGRIISLLLEMQGRDGQYHCIV